MIKIKHSIQLFEKNLLDMVDDFITYACIIQERMSTFQINLVKPCHPEQSNFSYGCFSHRDFFAVFGTTKKVVSTNKYIRAGPVHIR